MCDAVAAGQLIVGEAGDLQVASLEQDDGAGEQVGISTHGEQVIKPAECTHVVQLIV